MFLVLDSFYFVLFCIINYGVDLYTSFQKYCCFWLEKLDRLIHESTYTRENMVILLWISTLWDGGGGWVSRQWVGIFPLSSVWGSDIKWCLFPQWYKLFPVDLTKLAQKSIPFMVTQTRKINYSGYFSSELFPSWYSGCKPPLISPINRPI